jgi:MYXO-CTERM domain-containing protein
MSVARTDFPRRPRTMLSGLLVGIGLLFAGQSQASLMLTDSAVFSSNSEGENWNGWIWNTQGLPEDSANRWNLYYSSSSDPQNPVFLNSGNDAGTSLSIDMTLGTHSFLIFGESLGLELDPLQHFVLSLYFNDNQAAPDISGLYGTTCPSVCAASHWNGLDLFGNSGLGGNTNAQEAGTLMFIGGDRVVQLTKFNWAVNEDVDQVWAHWDNSAPFDSGSGTPDFVGEVELTVQALNSVAVSEPPTLGLFATALIVAGLAAWQRRRQQMPTGKGDRS